MQRYGARKSNLLARRDTPGPMRNTLHCSAPGIEKTLLRALSVAAKGARTGPEEDRVWPGERQASPPTPSRRAIGRVFPVSL